ncbi:RNA-binding protein [Candidatus Woesearchaeota archaeon]|nr:RNA-binding protein [Candidatus Woesearchaeota archaeon]
MESLHMKDRDVVVPGDIVATGMGFLPSKGTYRESDKVIADRVGLLSVEGKVLKVVPLTGGYAPKIGDRVIGQVNDVLFSGWRVDLFGPYSAVLGVKDATNEFIGRGANLAEIFGLGDIVVCKLINVTSQKLIDVSLRGPGLRQLKGGRLIKVNAAKVPRIIGKDGTMVSMIKQATGINIVVGMNGMVWIDGTPEGEVVAAETIQKIQDEAHLGGLTNRIKDFLEQKTGKKVEPRAMQEGE